MPRFQFWVLVLPNRTIAGPARPLRDPTNRLPASKPHQQSYLACSGAAQRLELLSQLASEIPQLFKRQLLQLVGSSWAAWWDWRPGQAGPVVTLREVSAIRIRAAGIPPSPHHTRPHTCRTASAERGGMTVCRFGLLRADPILARSLLAAMPAEEV